MCTVSRRDILLASLALSAGAPSALAQNYPARAVRFVTSFAAGGNADILTRIVGDGLSKSLGQTFFTDNRPGGNNIIGTQFAAKSAPDGYTLLMISTSHTVNPALVGKELPYDTLRDFTSVTKVGDTPMVLVANPGLGVSNLKELIAKAKAAPGDINFSSSGDGSPAHMAGELFNVMAGIKTTHVPYKSTQQATTDAISGQVQLAYPSLSSVGEMIKAGKLRALGITSSRRSPVAPDIPTIAETLPGFQAGIWTGVVVPMGVPKPIIAKLNSEIIKVLSTPETRAKLANMGVEVDTGTPEEFDAFIDAEVKKWGVVLKQGSLRVETKR